MVWNLRGIQQSKDPAKPIYGSVALVWEFTVFQFLVTKVYTGEIYWINKNHFTAGLQNHATWCRTFAEYNSPGTLRSTFKFPWIWFLSLRYSNFWLPRYILVRSIG